ncbi:MAG: type II 3-dehydroquinate dehydratase [Candidatus Dormibacteria bacterium]
MQQERLRILVVNGPNLDLLGSREPAVYGEETLETIASRLSALAPELGCEVEFFQGNGEGQLIDALHRAPGAFDGVVLNPGALGHYSYALRDAVSAIGLPVFEVHLTNVFAREPFRRRLVVAPVAAGVIMGVGSLGYELAVRGLLARLGPGGRAR